MHQSKLPKVETSIFSVMSKMANKYDAVNLSQGFPNFPLDAKLLDIAATYIKSEYNQYAPMAGDLKLREIITKKTQDLYGKKYCPNEEITITAGATQAIFNIITTFIDKGDEVIIFNPAYDCYAPAIEFVGGKAVAIQLQPPAYAPDWEEVKKHICSKTKMIIINTPHNPSGMVFSEIDMLALQAIAEKNNLLVLSDEVYEHIIFEGKKHQSAARFESLSNRTFITASFGKTFHVTGWKIGYCLAPKHLMSEFQKIHQYTVFCVNHPLQKALAQYLEDSANYTGISNFYQQKRDLFLNGIKDSRFSFIPSKGTYFQLLDFSEITYESDISFAERITKEFKIATIPTSVFNKNKQDFKQIRVCFAKTDATLKRACEIFNKI